MSLDHLSSLIEMLFTYGVVLALSVWQLVSIRREIRRDREKIAAAKGGQERKSS